MIECTKDRTKAIANIVILLVLDLVRLLHYTIDTNYCVWEGCDLGRIIYNKLDTLLEGKGKKYQYLRDAKISPGIVEKLKNNTGEIDTRTIKKICKLLDCQPGDIMEYIEDDHE